MRSLDFGHRGCAADLESACGAIAVCTSKADEVEATLNVLHSIGGQLLERLGAALSVGTLTERAAAGLLNLAVAALVFLVSYLAWLAVRWIVGLAFRRAQTDKTTTAFVQTALKFLLLTIGAITALDAVGIKTSALLTSLGIAGLTIGFAAKDALSNLISGILIFIDRPFVIGDLVEIDGRYGRVDSITLRSTRIVTNDGKMLAVPNTEIINRTVASYTNYPHLRVDVAVNIAVTESIDRARSVLLGLVQGDPQYMTEPAPRVVVTALNDYNLSIELRVWIFNEREHIDVRCRLREDIFKAFTQAGIEMPYQTVQVLTAPMVSAAAGHQGNLAR